MPDQAATGTLSAVGRLRDYVIPLITPFTPSGDVDFDAARHNVRHTLRIPACGGIYFGSVYQEFWTLTTAERIELLGHVADELNGRAPLVVGVSSTSLHQTIELATAATQAGADILMVWPPLWGPRDRGGVFRYYELLASRTSLPMFIYSTTLPELGFYLEPSLIEELASAIPQIVGVKEGSGNITTFLSLTARLGTRLAVGTPFEEYWILARLAYPNRAADFLMGASRAMYMQTPERPYLADALQLVRQGKIEEAFTHLDRVQKIVAIQMDSFRRGVHPIALVKYACTLLGQRGADVRPPTPALSAHDRDAVRELLAALELLPRLAPAEVPGMGR